MSLADSKRKTLWHEQKGICLYCKDPLKSWNSWDACLDHIYPKSLNGTDANENLALVCYRCNSLKSDFTSLWQVVKHFSKMFVLFYKLLDVEKVQKALENGRIKTREAEQKNKHCASCTCHGREKIPNAISKVGTAPIEAINRSVRVEAYERRVAAFQRIKGASTGGSVRS